MFLGSCNDARLRLAFSRTGAEEFRTFCNRYEFWPEICLAWRDLPTLRALRSERIMPMRAWHLAFAICALGIQVCKAENPAEQVCRARLAKTPLIELGKAGQFSWSCSEDQKLGKGFYIVFVRPVGTYVLLKVPQGRSEFEFTPDVAGTWRWIVINTDPDRGKPDVESEPGFFQVTQPDESATGKAP